MKRFLAHADIVLAGVILTLLCIDRVNDAMKMIDHPLTKWILFALCGVSLLSGLVLSLEKARRRARADRRKEGKKTERMR